MPSDILLYFIYFEKAFDSVEWDFLYHSLKVFKFGPTLMKWIKTFYKNISSCIIYNGSFSEPFRLERGVRLGYPLSSYLIFKAIKILAISLRTNEHTEGKKNRQWQNQSTLICWWYNCNFVAHIFCINFHPKTEQLRKMLWFENEYLKTNAVWIGVSKNSVHWSKNVRNSLLAWSRANHKTQLSWKTELNPKDDRPMGFDWFILIWQSDHHKNAS